MSAVISLQHTKDVWSAYSYALLRCKLQDGASVDVSIANNFISSISADDASPAAVAVSAPTIDIDTVATPKRVEVHMPDATFPSVAATTKACTGTVVTPPSNTVLVSNLHGLANADRVLVTNVSGLAGITSGNSYFVVNASTNEFGLSTTKGGSPVAYTTSGTCSVTKQIQRAYYYITTGDPATSPIVYHGDLVAPLTPNGQNIIIRPSAEGLIQGEISVTT